MMVFVISRRALEPELRVSNRTLRKYGRVLTFEETNQTSYYIWGNKPTFY
jgi:hypothetical protein